MGGEHGLISLLALNGLHMSEATDADAYDLGVDRGRRTLVVTRKGAKVVPLPLVPRIARAIDLAIGERTEGPVFLTAGRQLDGSGGAGPHPNKAHAVRAAALTGWSPTRKQPTWSGGSLRRAGRAQRRAGRAGAE